MIPRLIPRLLLIAYVLHRGLHAEDFGEYEPLYAGTMLAFFSTNIDPGRLAVQTYFFETWLPGAYNKSWSFQKQKTIQESSILLLLETGITKFLDITLLASGSYNRVAHHDSLVYGDMRAFLGFQILRDIKGSWIPDLRFLLGENFPTGKYKHLDPKKLLSDSSGVGAYETFFVLVSRKIFYVFPKHPFNLNLNLVYTVALPATIKGFSVYGGDVDTRGRVKPGDAFLINLATEYSISRNWVLGLDMRYLHQNKSTFSGKTILPARLPSSEQASLAPCMEYNYNENFGVLGGAWFTVAGRNSGSFASGILSIYYEF